MRNPEVAPLGGPSIKQIEKIVIDQELQEAAMKKDDMIFVGEKVKNDLIEILNPQISRGHHNPEEPEV